MKSRDVVATYTTSIVIAQRLSTVAGPDQVSVYRGGTVVETGSYVSLLDKKGSRLYELIQSHDAGLLSLSDRLYV